jgi:hypothetical protein
LGLVDFFLEEVRVLVAEHLAGGHHFPQAGQPRFVIVAQPARVVEQDVGQLRALLADFQHLVHLFLVFDHGKADFGVVDGKDAFGGHCVLVQRHRDRAERLCREHGGIQARAVGANDDQMLAALQAQLVQAAGQMAHLVGHLLPSGRLPDAVFLLTHGSGLGPLGRMLQQQPGERCPHVVSCGFGAVTQGHGLTGSVADCTGKV